MQLLRIYFSNFCHRCAWHAWVRRKLISAPQLDATTSLDLESPDFSTFSIARARVRASGTSEMAMMMIKMMMVVRMMIFL